MRIRMGTRLVAGALAAGSVSAVAANDTTWGVENGTIVFQRHEAIRMDSEVLEIGQEEVRVAYVFTNTGAAPVEVDIAFPMPELAFSDADISGIDDFRLWVDGSPVRTQRRWKASLDGKDVTAQWQASGWTVDQLIGWVHSGRTPVGLTPLPAEWIGDDGEPRLSLAELFTWKQRFEPGKPVSIRHAYRPSIGSGVPQSAQHLIDTHGTSSCIDRGTRESMRRRDRGQGTRWANLRYVLTTGGNWNGPIGDFHLRIHKRAPDEILSLCFDGALRKTGPTTFEFRQEDYVPTHDLDLLYVPGTLPGD